MAIRTVCFFWPLTAFIGRTFSYHVSLVLNDTHLEQETYQNLKGFISLAVPYNFLSLTKPYQHYIFGAVDKYPDSQPIKFVSGSEPPALLLQGIQDTKVYPRNADNLGKILMIMRGCVQIELYPDLDHTDILAALAIPFRDHDSVLSNIIEFLNYYSSEKTQCNRINLKLTLQP